MDVVKVTQIGLGPVGLAILDAARGRRGIEVVGAVDPRPELVGREIRAGITVSATLEDLLERARPDVVLHATGSFLIDVANQFRALLGNGLSVVSTCEELAYPFYRHPELARELDDLAKSRGAVLLGTGVNPGFVMDKLAITLLGACRTARHVRVQRIVDAGTRREPLQRKIGAGITEKEFADRKRTGRFGHIGLPESAHMLADVLGVPADRVVREQLAPRLADALVVTPVLRVEAGRVAGIDQVVAIESGGVERVRLELQMYAGAANPRDIISIDGDPPIEMEIAGGIHGDAGTAGVVVNCAPSVRSLARGLRTMLDLPLRYGAAS